MQQLALYIASALFGVIVGSILQRNTGTQWRDLYFMQRDLLDEIEAENQRLREMTPARDAKGHFMKRAA